MNKNVWLIGIGILIFAVFFCLRGPQKPVSEFLPGTGCKVDADCKYITYETSNGSKISLCANPKEFSKFWNVSITINESVKCFCKVGIGTGGNPIRYCAKKP